MSTALLTPINRTQGAAVSGAPKRYRKQILPLTSINYEGKKIDFDKEFLVDLVRSFKEGAVHQTPFQIADGRNQHNNDPERTRGQLVDLELTSDGLDGIIDLDERGVEIVKNNPNLGISARILRNVERATDKKVFGRVLQHVLGTVDPKVPGMRPWEQVTLSNEGVTETIDLSAEEYPEMTSTKTKAPETKEPENKDEQVTLTLSKEDHAVFLQLIEDQKVAAGLALSNPDGEDPENGDEEDPEGGEGEPVGLSAEHVAAIELAKAESATAKSQVVELANQLRQAEVDREVDALRHTGLAPAIIDLARPVLELPVQAIELSNGKTVDPGKVMRELLNEVVELAGSGHLVSDLDEESGVLVGSDPIQTKREAKLTAWADENY